MARWVALDWDLKELRVLVATPRKGGLRIDEAHEIPLTADTSSEASDRGAQTAALTSQLGMALSKLRLPKGEAFFLVSRSEVELKQMTLPPAPDADLPDMVRFQAQKEFTTLGDDWPLNFVPLSHNPDEARVVLAAALPPERQTLVQAICTSAGWKPRRLVLRPYALAALWEQQAPKNSDLTLLVDVLSSEADMAVAKGSQVLFSRTARLRGDLGADLRPLVTEIRRTLAASNSQLAPEQVASVVLCGDTPAYQEMARKLGEELGISVSTLDPWATFDVDRGVAQSLSPNVGRFCALLGMLQAESQTGQAPFDFLNVRKPPEAKSHKRLIVPVAIAAGVLALVAALFVWWQLSQLDAEIAALEQESFSLDKPVAAANEEIRKHDLIERWNDQEVVWLDEISNLSQKLPASEEMMVTQLNLAPHPLGGEIMLDGLVKDSAVIDAAESRLRDDTHSVNGQTRLQDQSVSPYSWRFKSAIRITDPKKKKPGTSAEPEATQPEAATSDSSGQPRPKPDNAAAPGTAPAEGAAAAPSGNAADSAAATSSPTESAPTADTSAEPNAPAEQPADAPPTTEPSAPAAAPENTPSTDGTEGTAQNTEETAT